MTKKSLEARIGTPVAVKKPIEETTSHETYEKLFSEFDTIYAEKKSDGNRVQIHVDEDTIALYSSRLNQWDTECFPDLVDSLRALPNGVYDGEILGRDQRSKATEFGAITARPTSNPPEDLDALVETYPLQVDLFDVLNFEGASTLQLPLKARRVLLEQFVATDDAVQLSELHVVDSAHALDTLYKNMTEERALEGLVIKDPDSPYVPKSRDGSWRKLKKFTTWDLVVLGTYATANSEKKGLPFSGLLCGTYNTETEMYETLAKLPISGKAKTEEIFGMIASGLYEFDDLYEEAAGVSFREKIPKGKMPQELIAPDESIVIEVQAMDVTFKSDWHSCGYNGEAAHTLRIASYQGIRLDKTEALRCGDENILPTTTQEIQKFYFG